MKVVPMKTVALFVSLFLALPALAGNGMTVEGWARATASKARNGAVYLSIRNDTNAGDRILASQTEVARHAKLHNHIMAGGVMKMRPVATIDVPAHGMVMMRPGGLHVMLTGLKHPLVNGETLPLTVFFEQAGAVNVQVKIMSIGAKGMHESHKN